MFLDDHGQRPKNCSFEQTRDMIRISMNMIPTFDIKKLKKALPPKIKKVSNLTDKLHIDPFMVV